MKTSRHRASFLSRRRRSTAHFKANPPENRRLRFETLEDRRMLAVTYLVDSWQWRCPSFAECRRVIDAVIFCVWMNVSFSSYAAQRSHLSRLFKPV